MVLKWKDEIRKNPALHAVTSVLLVLPVLSFSRLCLWIFNPGLFEPEGYFKIIAGGLRFDLSALLMVNLLYLFLAAIPLPFRSDLYYRRFLSVLFVTSNTLAVIPNLADAFYFPFSMKRTGWEVFSFLSDGGGGDLLQLLPTYVRDFWPASLLLVFIVFLFVLITRKIKVPAVRKMSVRNYLVDFVILIVILGFSVIGIRGGLQLKPVNILSASAYASPGNTPLVYSSTFSIIKTYGISALQVPDYFKDEAEMKSWFNPLKEPANSSTQMKKNNVVIIILESFSTEYVGVMSKGSHKNLTPFIDSLCGVSLWYSGISNSKRSIEALPAILSGLPNLMIHDYITSPYAGNEINSVASLLKQEGYNTSFYHGGNNGTMGFDAYCQMAGFEHYYGRNEYPEPNDFDGKWGIWDHAFFSWFASSLNKTPQPFVSGIFSLSSHHPYSIPPGMEKQFPQGETKIMATIAYTDYALRLFFDKAKTMPWFDNTLFVITADHTSETKDPWYQTRAGMYSIPVIFYKHNEKLQADSDRVVQQTDILPTVLDYLQYPSPFLAFGNSVFDTTSRAFAVNFVNPEYTIFMQNHMMILAGDSASYVYDIQKDSFQKQNILNLKNEFQLQMLQSGKSLIQQYNQRMVSNNLTIRRK